MGGEGLTALSRPGLRAGKRANMPQTLHMPSNRAFPLKPNLLRSFFISDRPTPPSEKIQQTSEEAGDGIA